MQPKTKTTTTTLWRVNKCGKCCRVATHRTTATAATTTTTNLAFFMRCDAIAKSFDAARWASRLGVAHCEALYHTQFCRAANKVVFQRVKQQKPFRKLLPKST